MWCGCLFYAAPHTVDGLDGASSTTLKADEEETLTIGAAGYAALARAAYTQEAVTLSGLIPQQWRAWATARLQEFERRLTPRYEPARWATWG